MATREPYLHDSGTRSHKAGSVILLLGSKKDELTHYLYCELAKRVRRIHLVDESKLFSSTPFAFKRTGRRTNGYVEIDGEQVPLRSISGALVRLPREWWPGGEFDAQDQMFVYHETTAAWFNLLTSLPCPVVNRFSLGWWLQDLNYPLHLGNRLSEEIDVPMVPGEPSLSFEVRLLPTIPARSTKSASIYLVGSELFPGPGGAATIALPLLRRKRAGLAKWQSDNDISFCRLDFELESKPLLKRVETFPLFQNERKAVVNSVISAIADILS